MGIQVRSAMESIASQYPLIGDVRGLGPMLALELVKDRKTKEPAADEAKKLVTYCQNQGLMIIDCGTYHNTIRTLMPLTITPEQLAKGQAILESGFQEISTA